LAALEHQQRLARIDQLWALHESQLWAKKKMRWATMASFREVKASCGLREKENGQLWSLLEKKEPTVG
jgi:hypothetical protein